MVVFQKDDQPKATARTVRIKRGKKKKRQAEVIQPGILFFLVLGFGADNFNSFLLNTLNFT